MTTTSKTYPERIYSLSVMNDLGEISQESKDYISGLMRISGERDQKNNRGSAQRKLSLAEKIKNNHISEPDLFFLKDYIYRYYPDYKNKLKFELLKDS